MDTATKRSGAGLVGLPFRNRLPVPDGAVGQGDRQMAAFWYPGVLAGAAANPVPGVRLTARDAGALLTARDGGATLAARDGGATLEAPR